MAVNSNGNCYICGVDLGKAAMKNHLFKLHGNCKEGQECYLLKIEGAYRKEYWLYIDAPVDKTLSMLDGFLRKIWLECCGHMSAFFQPGPGYVEIKMSRKLGNFAVGDKLLHHYDFGSTTETLITIVGSVMRKPQKNAVRLLARNVPLVFKCEDCGKPAEYIYMDPNDEGELPFYCAECGNNYDGYMLNPVTNSPRMGECGYDGELDTFTFNPKLTAHKADS